MWNGVAKAWHIVLNESGKRKNNTPWFHCIFANTWHKQRAEWWLSEVGGDQTWGLTVQWVLGLLREGELSSRDGCATRCLWITVSLTVALKISEDGAQQWGAAVNWLWCLPCSAKFYITSFCIWSSCLCLSNECTHSTAATCSLPTFSKEGLQEVSVGPCWEMNKK